MKIIKMHSGPIKQTVFINVYVSFWFSCRLGYNANSFLNCTSFNSTADVDEAMSPAVFIAACTGIDYLSLLW